ncbi:16S rRNA (guanine(527)-N(7))-methyltransferase RsmG [Arcobacter sp. FWKO B]|uniref:16S rRNA (guanine(527)-N(7))-methyltransferase RsmG n=1 Tax=Arcobacter sp. FWKO B TaxID=2593672 RepID=UPI0018A36C7B|nr:16S rRNA (guanine(527)-N(7))-methyltransferase RsmG [Arcobacter sp. FWKO B]QOG13194.1 16S rRNA (guanine(527)-N(7))-methyltransferase RsmG [Arcobacter sp. FWKO B]
MEDLQLTIHDSQFLDRCETFIKLLQQWGKVHNLSGSLDRESIMANIEDSIYPLGFVEDFGSFLDVGTGAGFPGLIIAMARPEVIGYLVEPRAKRVAFLHFVKSTLKLDNLTILQKRVEDVKLESPIELITSRAVTNTKLLLDLTEHMSGVHTKYLFYKGSVLDDELNGLKIEGKKIVQHGDRKYLYF